MACGRCCPRPTGGSSRAVGRRRPASTRTTCRTRRRRRAGRVWAVPVAACARSAYTYTSIPTGMRGGG
eukprot:scaffold6678_cov336-Prasinococcus_capsulatus_cf.AAC.11